MKCSKCDAQMTQVTAAYGETVGRCDNCHGLFVSRDAFAMLERDWLLWPKSDSHSVDAGHPRVGKRFDKISEIDCPACGTRMEPISMPDQQHIWVEQCPLCDGVFFDAGELTDLRYHTMRDWLRGFLKGPRTTSQSQPSDDE